MNLHIFSTRKNPKNTQSSYIKTINLHNFKIKFLLLRKKVLNSKFSNVIKAEQQKEEDLNICYI